jgi:hypothetical protein
MKKIILFILIFLPLIMLAQQPESGTFSSGIKKYRLDPTSQSDPMQTTGTTVYNSSVQVTYSADYIHLNQGFNAGSFNNSGFFRTLKPLKASITETDVTCHGGSNGTATVTASAGYPPYTYLWNDGSTTATITGLRAGTYSCTITDSRQQTLLLSVTIDQPIEMEVVYNVNQYPCYDYNQGAVTLTVTNGTPPYTCNQCQGGTLRFSENPGAYTVSISDYHNCQVNKVVYITNYQITDVTLNGSYCLTKVTCGSPSSIITEFTPYDGVGFPYYRSNLNPLDGISSYSVDLEWVDTSYVTHTSGGFAIPNEPLIDDPGLVRSLTKLTIRALRDNCSEYVKYFNIKTPISPNSISNNIFEKFASINIYPNPFSQSTNINYSLIEPGNVKMSLLDVTSRVVKVLIDEKQQEGEHQFVLDGSLLETGVYFVSFEINGFKKTEKIIVTK